MPQSSLIALLRTLLDLHIAHEEARLLGASLDRGSEDEYAGFLAETLDRRTGWELAVAEIHSHPKGSILGTPGFGKWADSESECGAFGPVDDGKLRSFLGHTKDEKLGHQDEVQTLLNELETEGFVEQLRKVIQEQCPDDAVRLFETLGVPSIGLKGRSQAGGKSGVWHEAGETPPTEYPAGRKAQSGTTVVTSGPTPMAGLSGEKLVDLEVDIPKQRAKLQTPNGEETFDLPSEGVARWLKVLADHPDQWIRPDDWEKYGGVDLQGVRSRDKLRSLDAKCPKLGRLIATSKHDGTRFESAWTSKLGHAPRCATNR